MHVIAPSASGIPSHDWEEGVRVHRIVSHHWPLHPTWMICMPWETGPAVAQLLDDIRPDVLHTQAHFVIGRFAITHARRRGIPVVATNHFMPDNVRPYVRAPRRVLDTAARLAWWDLRSRFQRADHITVPTQLASDLLTENGFDRPIEAVSCGIDLARFDGADPAPEAASTTAPAVLFVGRLSQEKRPQDIVEALAAMDPALGLEARIVGAGDQEEVLPQLARDLGVGDRVKVLGKISDAQLDEEYRRATVFCMPSTAELQSIATLEALASGLPVVLADAVALPHLVRDGENGGLFRPRDAQDLARVLTRVVSASDQERRAMGAVSQEIAAHHDIRRTLARYEEIYRSVSAGSPEAPSLQG
ncbi:Glycosyltransferase involved in cell wall bisynthesis [Brevibacterium sp. Mu109]|nr:Glycosyltransferase involved in cell wall bisynthesis [Brevibacterium sp. Mu109]